MSDDRRWIEHDDAPDTVVALLRVARKARPLDARIRERSRRRVAVLGALPAAAGVVLWFQSAAFGAVLGTVVTTAVLVAPRYLAPAKPSPSAVERSMRPHPVVPGQRSSALPARDEPPGSERALAAASSASPALRRETPPKASRAVALATDAGEHALEREARLLERARAAMASDPRRALAVVAEHEAEFPDGALGIERELLAVEALVRLGHRGEAETRAAALRARAPGGLYTRRLEHLLGGAR
jgi:hypothetical protein